MKELREYLAENVSRETYRYFGYDDRDEIEHVVNAWLNDETNSEHRYQDITLAKRKSVVDVF